MRQALVRQELCVLMTLSGPGTEQRKNTVFYILIVKGFKHWQMENVIALDRADQINSMYMEGKIIFCDCSQSLLFYQ